jgi:hypothetical protein
LFVFKGVGNSGPGLGQAVGTAGDVDRDGFDDLLVSFRTGNQPGRVQVLSGRDGVVLFAWAGTQQADQFGQALDGAGDVDGDGHPDVVVGVASSHAAGTYAGAAHVFSGRDGSLLHSFAGTEVRERLGGAVGGAGDVNHDGHADVLVGGQPDPLPGRPGGLVRLYSGADGAVLMEVRGAFVGTRLGAAVDGAGDVNGDGTPDLLIGDWGEAAVGSATVLSGVDGAVLLKVLGEHSSDRMGLVVAGLGDLDGDGLDDVLFGSQWADDGPRRDVGQVRVHSGASGALLHSIHGDATYDFFGGSVAGVGDFDGDGVPDFAVGAFGDDDGGTNAGSVRVYSGADGSVVLRVDGDSSGDELGYSVAAAGDVSGAGGRDLILGAPADDQGGGPGSGAAFVLAGAAPASSVASYCTPGPNAWGAGATLGWTGSNSVAAGDLALTVTGARPRGIGVFFFGAEQQERPFMKGTLCVGGRLSRMGPPVHLDGSGGGVETLEGCRWPWDRGLLVAGSSWNFQFIYLDPPARKVGPFNLSDAVHVELIP